MRRKDREITDPVKIDEIIKSCDCCRIGLYDDNKVYIVPLNFGYVNNNGKRVFYFHSASEGRKLDLINRNGYASFEMDTAHKLVPGSNSHHCTYLYQCVMGEGRISIVADLTEKLLGLNAIMSQYTGKSDNTFEQATVDRTSVIRLDIENLSCKMH